MTGRRQVGPEGAGAPGRCKLCGDPLPTREALAELLTGEATFLRGREDSGQVWLGYAVSLLERTARMLLDTCAACSHEPEAPRG